MTRRVRWWRKLPGAFWAARTYLCTPMISIEDGDLAQLHRQSRAADQLQSEADLLEQQTHELRLGAAAARLVDARVGSDPTIRRGVRFALLSEDLPRKQDGTLHEPALSALVETALWGARIDATLIQG